VNLARHRPVGMGWTFLNSSDSRLAKLKSCPYYRSLWNPSIWQVDRHFTSGKCSLCSCKCMAFHEMLDCGQLTRKCRSKSSRLKSESIEDLFAGKNNAIKENLYEWFRRPWQGFHLQQDRCIMVDLKHLCARVTWTNTLSHVFQKVYLQITTTLKVLKATISMCLVWCWRSQQAAMTRGHFKMKSWPACTQARLACISKGKKWSLTFSFNESWGKVLHSTHLRIGWSLVSIAENHSLHNATIATWVWPSLQIAMTTACPSTVPMALRSTQLQFTAKCHQLVLWCHLKVAAARFLLFVSCYNRFQDMSLCLVQENCQMAALHITEIPNSWQR